MLLIGSDRRGPGAPFAARAARCPPLPAEKGRTMKGRLTYHEFGPGKSSPVLPDVGSQARRAPPHGTALPSRHYHAAIYMERLTGYVPCLGAREIDCGGGDIVRRPEAAHRDRRHDPPALLVAESVGHRGRYHA